MKQFFPRTYDPKNTAKTVCINFQELVHKPGEKVYDYFICNVSTFQIFMDGRPKDFICG
jgi:hypothetical protein